MVAHEIDQADDGVDVDLTRLAYTLLPPQFAVREEWVMTRRQRITVFCAVVLTLTTGVVAVALGFALAA